MPQGDLDLDNPGVLHHLRAEDGVDKLNRGLIENTGTPDDPDDWHYLTQLVQARSQQAGTEWLRSRDRCSGVIIWQLNDCWPALSWAAVDHEEHLKPLWYSLRRAFTPQLLTLQPTQPADAAGQVQSGDVAVVAVNDAQQAWPVEVVVRRLDLRGRELARSQMTMDTAPDVTTRALIDPAVAIPEDHTAELLVAEGADGLRSWWFFAKDVQMDLPPPAFEASIRRISDDAVELEVRALTLLRDVVLYPDRAAYELGLDPSAARVDDMLVSLLPGEQRTFTLNGVEGIGSVAEDKLLAVLADTPVLRMVGDLDNSP
ncbi:hypothetical protein BH23ACT6_BH23ACT6_04060 [soil metagenome]